MRVFKLSTEAIICYLIVYMYMPTYAFVNFFGNMQATMMSQMGDLDLTDAAAVKAVFDSIDNAVNTINVSFVMEKAAK